MFLRWYPHRHTPLPDSSEVVRAQKKKDLSVLFHTIFWQEGDFLRGQKKYWAIITEEPPFEMLPPHSDLVESLYYLLNSHYTALGIAQYKANERKMRKRTRTSPSAGESMSKPTVELTSQHRV